MWKLLSIRFALNMLSQDQLRRYSRNILLPSIGEAGQQKLLSSRVLVVGAGGLGSATISYLAAAGVGHIGIADGDRVELSNLQRQILFEQGDISRLKVEAARDRVEELNPDVKITTYAYDLNAANIAEIISNYDIVADGCDNFETRFIVADACAAQQKTLVSAAVKGFEGQLSTFKPYLGEPHPSYRCFVPEIPPEANNCTETGVIGAVCGILGSMQAVEIIKELLGLEEGLSGVLLRYDALAQKCTKSILTRCFI